MRKKFIFITGLVLVAALLSAFIGGTGLQTASAKIASAKIASAKIASAKIASAQTTPTETPRTINVTGNGKAYLTPDIAYINIGVHTEDTNAAEAVGSNNTQSQKVADALKEFDIDPKDMQTTNFSIYPQQQVDPNGKVTGITYMVDNTVFVTLRDLDQLGEVIGAAVDAGANSINSIQFDAADRTKALSEARKAAVTDALAQARELASAAGVTLGDIQTINSYGGQPMPVFEAKGYGGGMAVAGSPVPVSPGQMVLTLDVNIVFLIK